MAGWVRHEGQAVVLPIENIDTDQLIPARFMSAPRSDGYGGFLLHDMRDAKADFPLNKRPNATVLVAGRNFGCGSSREAAVYALVDAGFRAVIAPSFGDIFASNAVNNGLLPAQLPQASLDRIAAAVDGKTPVSIDLEAAVIRAGGAEARLELDATWRLKLIKGWDDIDLTGSEGARIAAFARARQQKFPWAWPAA